MVNKLPPHAGPVNASGEPERWALVLPESVKALEAKSLTTGRLLSDADCFQWVKAVDLAPCAVEHPVGPREYRCVNCRAVVSAAAVPSSPAQKPRLTDLQRICNLNVMQAMAVQQYIERLALPPSSPVAGSPTLDDVRIVLRQFEMRAYRADALPPGNHRLKPTLTEWREMAQWLYDTLRRAVPTLAESGEVNAGHR